MPKRYIPRKVPDISPEWLTGALTESGILKATSITSVDHEVIGADKGFMGRLIRCRLKYAQPEENAPTSLIAKLPTEEKKNWLIGDSMMLYENENRIYMGILPDFSLKTPQCYFADMDPGLGEKRVLFLLKTMESMPKMLSGVILGVLLIYSLIKNRRYVLLMEDLEGLDYIDHRLGCSFEDTKLVMQQMGRAQGGFWEDSRLDQYWLKPHAEIPKLLYGLYAGSLKTFRKYFWDQISDKNREIVDWLTEHHFDLRRVCLTRPTTLAHNDFRLDNVFFNREKNEIAVIDWSSVKKGPVALDVAYFNMSAGSEAYSVEQIHELAKVYYEALVEGGATNYGFEEFMGDYRRAQLLAYQALIVIIGKLEMDNDPGLVELATIWMERIRPQFQDFDLSSCLAVE